MTEIIKPWHSVRRSRLHGNGVFATRKIPAGTPASSNTAASASAPQKPIAGTPPIRTIRSIPSSSR